MISLTDNQSRAIKAAVDDSQDGVKRALNPAKSSDAAAIRAFLELSGKTPATHPGLYADLANSEAAATGADHPLQVLDIVDSGRDAQGRATARVWHLDREGELMAGSVALVLDSASGQPLALGYANRVGGGVCPAATRSESAQPASDKITTVGFYHSQSAPDAMPKFGMVKQSSTVASSAPATLSAAPSATSGPDATVTAPVISVTGHTNIVIALGRPGGGTDADYYYAQDNTGQDPALLVPFTGTVNTHSTLTNLDANGNFTSGLVLNTQLYGTSGGSYVAHDSSQSITNQVTGDASTGIVTWSYPFDPAHTDPSNTPSLIYGTLASARDTTTAFFFSFQIPVAGPTPYQMNVCSTDWPGQPSVNCVQIPNLQFWWHCLAEGTLVTLADGSTTKIEAVGNTHRVRTGHGEGALGVEATTRGLHHPVNPNDPTSAVLKLTTAKGRALILTGGHPVATDNGLVLACDLKPGMTLRAEDGGDRLASVEPHDFDGGFVNLKLINDADRALGLAGSVGTFIANGLVVGDFASMKQAHYNNTHSIDYMKNRLPARYHQDYASALAMIARDNITYGANY